jgi:hypothetical protein
MRDVGERLAGKNLILRQAQDEENKTLILRPFTSSGFRMRNAYVESVRRCESTQAANATTSHWPMSLHATTLALDGVGPNKATA